MIADRSRSSPRRVQRSSRHGTGTFTFRTWPRWFTGGTISRVAVDVSGQPYLDLEREAAAMLARE
jgi:hypothetical protein